jgi:4-amino-4-deoxy-L-arabinose transferase-like glycosyltransferase
MISAPLVFRFAYVFRPEVMLMALGFLSFCLVTACLSRRRDGGSRRPPVLALGAGALAGLGLLTHLNGWIFIAAGSAVLLSRRARTAAAAFAGAAAAVSALYFWDLTSAASVEMFRYQASSDLPIGDAPVWGRLLNIVYEPKRFFYSIREIFPSSLLVLSTIFAWRTLASKYRDLLVYLCVLIVGLAVLSRPRPSYYMVLYMPYIALVITVGIGQLGSLGPAKRAALTSVLAAHFAFSVFYAFTVIRSGSDLPRMNERIASNVPRGATLVAPAGFIFDQVANYRIQSLTLYDRLGDRRGKKLSAPEFFDLARSYGNAYVLVNREFGRKIGLEPPEGQMTIGGYSLVADVEGTLVFRLSQAGS